MTEDMCSASEQVHRNAEFCDRREKEKIDEARDHVVQTFENMASRLVANFTK